MRVLTRSSNPTHSVEFPMLTGGLNLYELDYRLPPNQSPNMKNLWWQDGVIQCRDGQVYINAMDTRGTGFTCFPSLFNDYAFFHIGPSLYYGDPTQEQMELVKLVDGVPLNRGTFFRYFGWLFYKNKGGFFRITYQPVEAEKFKCESVSDIAYVPIIQLNTDPETGGGDRYQPENRLTPEKIVKFTAKSGVSKYQMPLKGLTAVTEVIVDGTKLEPSKFTPDLAKGTVTFFEAPPVTDPPTPNTVEIKFTKADENAAEQKKSIMDCNYASVSGTDKNLCILMAGADEQPNAIFWNSNDALSMNPTYWPFSYYNLVGDTEEPVTGFGRQYSDTIVLKEHSVGKLGFTIQKINERDSISFTYTNINNKIGCDLPWSIQLIENNLVFCNTYEGVQILRSSSAAYENNVEGISRNVNGQERQKGLLEALRNYTTVTSFDDDDHYWLCVDGKVFLWDFVLSKASDPSWFYFDSIPAVAMFADNSHKLYHLDALGRVTKFDRVFADYGKAIDKVYQFPTQHFGTYERLKDVTSLVLSVRSDTDTEVQIKYATDYNTRYDLTEVRSYQWNIRTRNLTYRFLGTNRYAKTARRNPGCRHIRHFSMTFSNNKVGQDLAIVSAQLFYKYQGKER